MECPEPYSLSNTIPCSANFYMTQDFERVSIFHPILSARLLVYPVDWEAAADAKSLGTVEQMAQDIYARSR